MKSKNVRKFNKTAILAQRQLHNIIERNYRRPKLMEYIPCLWIGKPYCCDSNTF